MTTLTHTVPQDRYHLHPSLSAWRQLAWGALLPVRWYLRYAPISRGKGVLLRNLLLPALPERELLDVTLPCGATVSLKYRERLAIRLLIQGFFENSELELLRKLAVPGSTVIDVGANVGIFTFSLASAVGAGGEVIAVEPLSLNIARLRRSLERNRSTNVVVIEAAAGAREGFASIDCASDPAFAQASTATGGVGMASVTLTTLDSIWARRDKPAVSLVKIDVEGFETDVIRGAQHMLRAHHPAILAEANDAEHLEALQRLLEPEGYSAFRPAGFEPWNYLFLTSALASRWPDLAPLPAVSR